jgi:hypothetical protein
VEVTILRENLVF